MYYNMPVSSQSPVFTSMNIPLNTPPCMMKGQYGIIPPQPNVIDPDIYMDMTDTEDYTGGMYPQDLPMNNNYPAWPITNNGFITGNDNIPALQIIKESVKGESEDRLFYEYLIRVAGDEDDKNIIKGIRDDEIKHFEFFRNIYKELTRTTLPILSNGDFKEPDSYCNGIRDALLGEQRAVQKYRIILFSLKDTQHKIKITEIITDELRHGILFNYLYSKNNCRK